MKKRIVTTLIGALLVSGAIVAKPDHREKADAKRDGIRHMMKELRSLDLEKTQKADIRLIVKTLRADMKANRPEHTPGERPPANLTEAELAAAIEARFEAVQANQLARAKAKHAIYQVLTETQQEALAAKKAEKAQKRSNHADKRKRPDAGKLPPAFDELDLSDDQLSAVQATLEQGREQRQQSHAKMQQLREQERTIIQAETFDEAAWLALSQQFKAALIDSKTARLQQQEAMESILSDEQLTELKEIHDEHRRGPKHRRG
ncbi:Spy/CpxP family protein refolding chaperone [Salinimonas sediminis]|nr:Spy/CpxP family protein refolding chaperone [Salinimonas sediminis]